MYLSHAVESAAFKGRGGDMTAAGSTELPAAMIHCTSLLTDVCGEAPQWRAALCQSERFRSRSSANPAVRARIGRRTVAQFGRLWPSDQTAMSAKLIRRPRARH
jgi:hypothetical protein